MPVAKQGEPKPIQTGTQPSTFLPEARKNITPAIPDATEAITAQGVERRKLSTRASRGVSRWTDSTARK